jgi:tetratricopeptide (TPR) repeat protein
MKWLPLVLVGLVLGILAQLDPALADDDPAARALGDRVLAAGQFEQAVTVWSDALMKVRASGDVQGEIDALTNRSLAYQELGNIQLALADLKQARRLAQQIGASERIAAIDSRIGNALVALGANDDAMPALTAALVAGDDGGNPAVVASALNSMGSVLYARRDFEGSLAAYRQSALMAFLPMAVRQHFLPWAAVVGAVGVFEARRRSRMSAIERERLRAEAAEQRLVALSSQLQPHFLFNTLQGISTLIHRDPQTADEMLTRLSDLLRDVLGNRDRTRVRFADEIRYARTYLEIAQIRFGPRLTFEIDVPDELQHASVPLFLLQPLIENALKHGVGAQIRGGRITIRGRRHGDRLHIEVSDDGPGFGAPAPLERVGLGNTRERLNAAFPNDHALSLVNDGGAYVRIEIPWREEQVTA